MIDVDWINRKYYTVSFSRESYDYRVMILTLIPSVQIHMFNSMKETHDELKPRGTYQMLISCNFLEADMVEYELRKAERRDGWCKWEEAKQNITLSNNKMSIGRNTND